MRKDIRLSGLAKKQLKALDSVIEPEPEPMEDGGAGSGNWGHLGRPGKRGGSGKGTGGAQFRSGSRESGFSRNHEAISKRNAEQGYIPRKRPVMRASPDFDKDDHHGNWISREEGKGQGSRLGSASMLNHALFPDNPYQDISQVPASKIREAESSAIADLDNRWKQDGASFGKSGNYINPVVDYFAEKGRILGYENRVNEGNFVGLSREEATELTDILQKNGWKKGSQYASVDNVEREMKKSKSGDMQRYLLLKNKMLGGNTEIPSKQETEQSKWAEKNASYAAMQRAWQRMFPKQDPDGWMRGLAPEAKEYVKSDAFKNWLKAQEQ